MTDIIDKWKNTKGVESNIGDIEQAFISNHKSNTDIICATYNTDPFITELFQNMNCLKWKKSDKDYSVFVNLSIGSGLSVLVT